MRNIVAAIAGAALSLGALSVATAADLPAKAPAAYVPPPPPVSWTQCYFGGNVGGGWSHVGWSAERYRYYGEGDGYSYYNNGSGNASGIVGGLQVGCDYQVNNWVWGIQGMFDWANLSGGGDYIHARSNWFATLTGRVGYLVQPATLLYFKGGAAWTQNQISSNGYYGGEYGSYCYYYNCSSTNTRTGWTVGGGVEYKINPSWSVFVEYNYMDFGSVTRTFSGSGGYDYERVSASQNIQNVLVGLNWRWGGGATGAWGW